MKIQITLDNGEEWVTLTENKELADMTSLTCGIHAWLDDEGDPCGLFEVIDEAHKADGES
jgi:hypothetical protein